MATEQLEVLLPADDQLHPAERSIGVPMSICLSFCEKLQKGGLSRSDWLAIDDALLSAVARDWALSQALDRTRREMESSVSGLGSILQCGVQSTDTWRTVRENGFGQFDREDPRIELEALAILLDASAIADLRLVPSCFDLVSLKELEIDVVPNQSIAKAPRVKFELHRRALRASLSGFDDYQDRLLDAAILDAECDVWRETALAIRGRRRKCIASVIAELWPRIRQGSLLALQEPQPVESAFAFEIELTGGAWPPFGKMLIISLRKSDAAPVATPRRSDSRVRSPIA